MIKGMTLEGYIADFENKARDFEEWAKEHHPSWLERDNEYRDVKGLLEELKDLREKYKNVSEAYMKVNNVTFDCKQELNKVSQELKSLRVEHEKNSKELEIYKEALGLAINDIKKFCESNEKSVNDCGCCALHGRCPLYGSIEDSINGDWKADYLLIARGRMNE